MEFLSLVISLVLLQSSKAEVQFTQTNQNLTFMFVTSFGQFGLNSSGVVPAADLALERINNYSDILPGYNLVYDQVRDSQCQHNRALDVFFDGIQTEPIEIAVVGCGCSVATGPVAEISHRWYIPQLSYVSGLPPLSDRTDFPGFFQNVPPFEMVTRSLHSLMDHFKWRRIAFLTQDELPFTRAELTFRLELEPYNITVENNLFETLDDPVVTNNDLFFEEDDYRVFILNCYPEPARRIICEAARRGYTYPRYAWITYDWYPQGWWESMVTDGNQFCESKELKQFLERSISLRWHPPFDQENNTTTDTGMTPIEFDNEYTFRASADGFGVVDAASSVYDILWVLAYALNNTMTMILDGDITESGCSGLSGSLVPLEDFNHRNKLMGCLIQWNLQNTNFSGVSGPIRYDVNRTRFSNRVALRQYLNVNGDLNRQQFAHLDRTENYTFIFETGFNNSVLFPDGIPLDGTILNITNTFETELVVVFDILATFGIGFVVGCFVFNFVFRNKKIVKVSSPSLNYFIILGALLMYSSIYFYLLPTLNTEIVLTGCILQTWLFTIGYSLAFGAVLAKMWRIYQIFHNPKPKKRFLKDWHLVAATLFVTGISIVLLLLEAGVPQLRGVVTIEKDSERPGARTEDLGIREEFYILVCYENSSPSFFWRILIFAYLAILQLMGIVLSFQTRKVKYTGLRDSKFVAIIIYISSIVVVVLALVTFSLRTYINIGTAIFLTGYFVLTTIFLAFIFIPKMVLLYKDPNGSSMTANTLTQSVNAGVRDTALKLNNFPSQLPRSGSDAQAFSVDISVETSQTS